MSNSQKKKLFKKIVFIIILIPTFLLIALICFTLIFGRQITEGAAKTVGNNFVKPIIAPLILVSNIINRNDKNGLKTAEEKVERNTQSDKTMGTMPTTELPNELISEFDNKSTRVKTDTFHVYFATDSNNNIINFKGKIIDSGYHSDLRKVFPKHVDYVEQSRSAAAKRVLPKRL